MVLFISLLVASFCKQTIVLHNNNCNEQHMWFQEQLAHTTDRITQHSSWLHWHTSNQHTHKFNFIVFVSSRL